MASGFRDLFCIGNWQSVYDLDLDTLFLQDWIGRSDLTIHQSQLSLYQDYSRFIFIYPFNAHDNFTRICVSSPISQIRKMRHSNAKKMINQNIKILSKRSLVFFLCLSFQYGPIWHC